MYIIKETKGKKNKIIIIKKKKDEERGRRMKSNHTASMEAFPFSIATKTSNETEKESTVCV